MNRSELWSATLHASMRSGNLLSSAIGHADEALRNFDSRFRTATFDLDGWLTQALDSYRDDHADSDHQRGYLGCLITLSEESGHLYPGLNDLKQQLQRRARRDNH